MFAFENGGSWNIYGKKLRFKIRSISRLYFLSPRYLTSREKEFSATVTSALSEFN